MESVSCVTWPLVNEFTCSSYGQPRKQESLGYPDARSLPDTRHIHLAPPTQPPTSPMPSVSPIHYPYVSPIHHQHHHHYYHTQHHYVKLTHSHDAHSPPLPLTSPIHQVTIPLIQSLPISLFLPSRYSSPIHPFKHPIPF